MCSSLCLLIGKILSIPLGVIGFVLGRVLSSSVILEHTYQQASRGTQGQKHAS